MKARGAHPSRAREADLALVEPPVMTTTRLPPSATQAPTTGASRTDAAEPEAPAAPTAPTPEAPLRTKGWLSKATDAVKFTTSFLGGGQAGKPVNGTSYDWNSARPMDAVPLPPLLDQLANTEDGRKLAAQIATDFHNYTHIPGTETLAKQAFANPRALTEGMIVTPGALSQGLSAFNTYKGGTPPAPPKHMLPQKFDLGALEDLPYENPFKKPDALQSLAPGIWRGGLPGKLSDEQARRNTAVAEVFDRLASNSSRAADQRFEVSFRGQSFTDVPSFMGALRKAGYEVNATFRTRTADFIDLKTGEPGNIQSLATPMMVRTGLTDEKGNEAIVPVTHSELVVSLKSPQGAEPNLDSKVRFFQGIDGIGFFPADIWHEGTWMGGVNRATVSGDQAQKAVEVASGLTALVEQAATANKLQVEGYGLTGVCNDSLAIIEQAVLGRVSEWPLLMRDDLLLKELAKLPPSAMRSTLEQAIRETPNDVKVGLLGAGNATPNADTRRRMLATLDVYPEGKAPWTRTEEARQILAGK